MIQAFDVLLQIPVTADIAAKNRIDEPFRYECLCCGEEVYIAATNSTKKAPHFRHRRGNSDRECELYLGSTGIAGALNAAQKRTHSRTEIYFDIKQKIFYAAVSFPKEKLQEFEDKSCILEFHSTYNSPPYEKVRINHQNFAPDSMVQFPLKLTTNDCYITISGANYRSHYEILSNNDFPTFFKITLGENSGNFARRIVGGKIYTNTSYYIIAKNQKIIQKIVDLGENIAISAVDEINALGSTIYGATLEILSVTPDLSNLFSYFNYSLEVSENITPLWPPLYSVDGVLCSNKKRYKLYHPTFGLNEARMVFDSISISQFLSQSQKNSLISQLEGFLSHSEVQQLKQRVRVRPCLMQNEMLPQTLQVIYRAIDKRKCLCFDYTKFDLKGRQQIRKTYRHIRPIQVVWEQEHYYLVAINPEHAENDQQRNYRIDRMRNVAFDTGEWKQVNTLGFSYGQFDMFSSKEKRTVKFRVHQDLLDMVFETFGTHIICHPDDERQEWIVFSAEVELSGGFDRWVLRQTDKIEVLAPPRYAIVSISYCKILSQATANKAVAFLLVFHISKN